MHTCMYMHKHRQMHEYMYTQYMCTWANTQDTWQLVHTHMHTRGGFQEPARRSQKQKESDIFRVTGSRGVGSVRPSAPSWALEGTSSCSPSPLGRHTQPR